MRYQVPELNRRYKFKLKATPKKQTNPVGSYPCANNFGLFDMHGQVWEWCLDAWHESYHNAPIDGSEWLTDTKSNLRVLRGGSWYNDPTGCRSAYRYSWDCEDKLNRVGLRIVCSS